MDDLEKVVDRLARACDAGVIAQHEFEYMMDKMENGKMWHLTTDDGSCRCLWIFPQYSGQAKPAIHKKFGQQCAAKSGSNGICKRHALEFRNGMSETKKEYIANLDEDDAAQLAKNQAAGKMKNHKWAKPPCPKCGSLFVYACGGFYHANGETRTRYECRHDECREDGQYYRFTSERPAKTCLQAETMKEKVAETKQYALHGEGKAPVTCVDCGGKMVYLSGVAPSKSYFKCSECDAQVGLYLGTKPVKNENAPKGMYKGKGKGKAKAEDEADELADDFAEVGLGEAGPSGVEKQ